MKKIELNLTEAEALVLFEYLSRNNENFTNIEDQAEKRVLWDIESTLEKQLESLFKPDYNELVLKAREKVRDKN